MRKFEAYAFLCASLGTVCFWLLFIYRLFNEGFSWLYETSDGIIIMGIIGLAGYAMMVADDALKGDLPLSKAVESELNFRFNLLDGKLDGEFQTLEGELKNKFDEVNQQLKYNEFAIAEIRDHLYARGQD